MSNNNMDEVYIEDVKVFTRDTTEDMTPISVTTTEYMMRYKRTRKRDGKVTEIERPLNVYDHGIDVDFMNALQEVIKADTVTERIKEGGR